MQKVQARAAFFVNRTAPVAKGQITSMNELKSQQNQSLEPAERLPALRLWMAKAGVDGLLVGQGDRFQGEETQASEQRLAWLSGFTGSAGLAIITQHRALLQVDSRYTIQAGQQVDAGAWAVEESAVLSLQNIPPGEGERRLGYDPWLFSMAQAKQLAQKAQALGWQLTPLANNPIDPLWPDRPLPAKSEIHTLPASLHGRSRADKLQSLAQAAQAVGAAAVLVQRPDTLCWALNIRGRDLAYSPVLLGSLLVHRDGTATCYLPASEGVTLDGVLFRREAELLDDLQALEGSVRLDPSRTAQAIGDALGDSAVVTRPCPAFAQQVIKTPAEIRGMQDCHARDGAAMTRVMRWLVSEALPRHAAGHPIDELEVEARILAERQRMGAFIGLSFPTIAAVGEHGAIVHYRASEASNAPLLPGSAFVMDSGGQYQSGTTDVTRSLWLGDAVRDDYAEAYTRVLMGMIELSLQHFPASTPSVQLDAIARRPLWQGGLNYGHGTGHGVGAGLFVHETPPSLGPSLARATPLKAGQILSNEPGFYVAEDYGIRTENLLLVTESTRSDWLAFETLTLVPIDLAPLRVSLLSASHTQWLQDYREALLATISPYLSPEEQAWLAEFTRLPADAG